MVDLWSLRLHSNKDRSITPPWHTPLVLPGFYARADTPFSVSLAYSGLPLSPQLLTLTPPLPSHTHHLQHLLSP